MDYTLNDQSLPLNDKDQHAYVGRAFGTWRREERDNRALAYAQAILLSIAKEAYDATDRANHTPDAFDAASTALGAIAGYEGWPIAPVVARDGGAILVRLTW
jgi:hypothetical protein